MREASKRRLMREASKRRLMREASRRSHWKTALVAGVGVATLAVAAPLAGPASAAGSGGTDVPMVALGDVRVVEGDAGRRVAKVPITLSRPFDSAAYFTVTTVDGDKGATAGVDYKPVVKRVRVPAGATYKTVGIPIYGDTLEEDTEFVGLEISRLDAPDVGFDKMRGSVIIDDDDGVDDPSKPSLSVSSVRLFEGDAAPDGLPTKNKVQLTFNLSEPQATDVFVKWRTESVGATAGVDYKSVASKVTRIAAGKVQKTVLVTVYGDDDVETDEDVNVMVDGVSGAGVGVGLGRGLILVMDDDADSDGDGLVDNAEGFYKTDPQNPDTDGDGIYDLDEVVVTLTNPNQADTDADGLEDLYELKVYGTDPLVFDTDGDGFSDGDEVTAGTDPLDPTDHPM
jgi:hypothetical protein